MRLSCYRPNRAISQLTLRTSKRHISDGRPFQPNDFVLLRQTNDRLASPVIRGPLKPGKRIDTHKGILLHDDIIGLRTRDLVRAQPLRSGKDPAEFRVTDVTLDDYVRLSRRLVTPIYPADANLIVSLLDLHPEVWHPSSQHVEVDEPKLEILEAGTGHGALTLYLSRAVHAANAWKPSSSAEGGQDDAMAKWRASRRAVIHTIDVSARYSEHAQKTVSAFRQGMYADNVEYHVGDVSEWVSSALPKRNNEPLLSHAFLDLPNADTHLVNVTKALRVDGTLIVFNPSITQITDCALKIKQDDLPLQLERVIELGVNGGSGGRDWDVRPVQPRASRKLAPAAEASASDEDSTSEDEAAADSGVELDARYRALVENPGSTSAALAEAKWSMVCRPKVGDRVVGGGFLGVWKVQRR